MKIIFPVLIVLLTFSNSCESQEKKEEIIINYSAQTRGYLYTLLLKNNALEINDNNNLKKVVLNEKQLVKIDSQLTKINFKEIENNISENDLAVDRAIKGVFIANFKGNSYIFDFDHNNLPKSIKQLFSELEEYSK